MEGLKTTDKSSIVNAINDVNNKSDIIIDHTVETDIQTVEFDVSLKPNEIYEIIIEGGVTGNTDVYLRVNEIQENSYFQGGYYFTNTATEGVDSLTLSSGYRTEKNAFYYGHSMRDNLSKIIGRLELSLDVRNNIYKPTYNWEVNAFLTGNQMIGKGYGFLNTSVEEITHLSFLAYSSASNVYFRKGTRFIIRKLV